MQKPVIEPKEFWDDMRWGRQHYSELVKKYPDKWVAIVDGKVVSFGDSPIMVEGDAEKRTGKHQNKIPLIFVESGSHVY